MPFRRRTVRRRPIRRRFVRRRRFIPRNRYRFRQRTYNFSRVASLANVDIIQAVNPTLFAYNFQLANLPSSVDFTALYDQYRIAAVRIMFLPEWNSFYPGTTAGALPSIPTIYTILDFDDSVSPANLSEVLQFKTVKMQPLNRMHSRYLKPRTAATVYRAGTTAAYSIGSRYTWINSAYADVQYFGVKGLIDTVPSTVNTSQVVKVLAKFYVQCRMVR